MCTRWAQVEPKFFDIDRVEVLRGPQATLYGASSMGGTIKFVPNEPDLKEREISTYGEYSSTKGGSANYSANVVRELPAR
ncbi:TonB-dependent receptor plug domain-containing protein [Massilia sp. H-1]|nr:TonB-dependent receptor plug domain-containing protein [Massilia sp. H-1]